MFAIAVTSSVLLFWGIVLAKFEVHRPRWRRLMRVAIAVAAAVSIDHFAGRLWFWTFIAAAHLPAAYIHLYWLPKKGVNGLTAEPYDLYLEVIGQVPTKSGVANPVTRA